MFIRWQKRKRRKPAFGYWGESIDDPTAPYGFVNSLRTTNKQDVHWSVVLIESVRIDGEPRQHHVAYLGGITDSATEIAPQRAWFWVGVLRRLDDLADQVSADDRKRIELTIAKKVPRPTKEEYAEIVRHLEEFWGAGTFHRHPWMWD